MTLEESHVTMTDKPLANPLVVLREEFDDWAILFDPDSGRAYGINPIGVFVWQRLNGKNTLQDILAELQDSCEDTPTEAREHVQEFVDRLLQNGLAGLEYQL